MHFFDAWRLAPSQAQRIVASDRRSEEESPLEQVVKEEEVASWATTSAPSGRQDVPTDPQGYELNRSTTRRCIDRLRYPLERYVRGNGQANDRA